MKTLEMRKRYITPQQTIVNISGCPTLLAGSAPGAGDQNNPGMSNASSMYFDDEY